MVIKMKVNDRSPWADNKTIGDRLKVAMIMKGTTYRGLSDATFYAASTICKIVNGEIDISINALWRICEYLDADPADLVNGRSPYDIYVKPDACAGPEAMSKRIGHLMAQRKMKSKELAKAIGVQQESVYRYLTGDVCPKYYVLVRLAQFFKISMADLAGVESPLDAELKEG